MWTWLVTAAVLLSAVKRAEAQGKIFLLLTNTRVPVMCLHQFMHRL